MLKYSRALEYDYHYHSSHRYTFMSLTSLKVLRSFLHGPKEHFWIAPTVENHSLTSFNTNRLISWSRSIISATGVTLLLMLLHHLQARGSNAAAEALTSMPFDSKLILVALTEIKNGPHQRSLHTLFIPKSVNKICILNFSGIFHPPLKHTVLLLSLSVTKTDFIWSRRVKPHSPWYEKRPLWSPSLPVFLLDCECVTSSVCPLVHRIKSNPADGHVLLNQHSDKWKTVNLNGLVKLASVLIAYQASGSSSCHGGEKKWTSLPKCWKQAGCLVP